MTWQRLRNARVEGSADAGADEIGIESVPAVGVTIASGRDIEEMARQMYADRYEQGQMR